MIISHLLSQLPLANHIISDIQTCTIPLACLHNRCMKTGRDSASLLDEVHSSRLIDVTDRARIHRLDWRVFITPRLFYDDPLRGRILDIDGLLIAPRGIRWFVDESGLTGPMIFVPQAAGSGVIVRMRIQVVRRENLILLFMASEFDDLVDYERLCPEDGKIPYLI